MVLIGSGSIRCAYPVWRRSCGLICIRVGLARAGVDPFFTCEHVIVWLGFLWGAHVWGSFCRRAGCRCVRRRCARWRRGGST